MRMRSRLRFILEGIEGAAIMAGSMVTWPVSKRWLADWGSSPAEREGAWPGDDLVTGEAATTTRAIDIDARPEAVWPWVVQFGLERGGFYSYELLERVAGIKVTNVESIEPSMQSIAIGDEVHLHPKAPGIPVAMLERGHYVCFGEPSRPGAPNRSWSIYVEPRDGMSRLMVRGCVVPGASPSPGARIATAIERPVDFVMEQRMLRTIKRLAEAGSPGPAAA